MIVFLSMNFMNRTLILSVGPAAELADAVHCIEHWGAAKVSGTLLSAYMILK